MWSLPHYLVDLSYPITAQGPNIQEYSKRETGFDLSCVQQSSIDKNALAHIVTK